MLTSCNLPSLLPLSFGSKPSRIFKNVETQVFFVFFWWRVRNESGKAICLCSVPSIWPLIFPSQSVTRQYTSFPRLIGMPTSHLFCQTLSSAAVSEMIWAGNTLKGQFTFWSFSKMISVSMYVFNSPTQLWLWCDEGYSRYTTKVFDDLLALQWLVHRHLQT